MRQITVVATAVMIGLVASQLTRDRRRGASESPSDLPPAVPALGERRDPLALEAGQVSAGALGLADARWRQAAVLLPPSKPRLASDAELAACLHGAHARGQ